MHLASSIGHLPGCQVHAHAHRRPVVEVCTRTHTQDWAPPASGRDAAQALAMVRWWSTRPHSQASGASPELAAQAPSDSLHAATATGGLKTTVSVEQTAVWTAHIDKVRYPSHSPRVDWPIGFLGRPNLTMQALGPYSSRTVSQRVLQLVPSCCCHSSCYVEDRKWFQCR